MSTTKLVAPRVEVLIDDQPEAGSYTEIVVQTDNRDMTGYDLARSRQKWPTGAEAPSFWTTWLAWSALKRSGAFTEPFERFNEVCVQVRGLNSDGSYISSAKNTPDEAEAFPEAPGIASS